MENISKELPLLGEVDTLLTGNPGVVLQAPQCSGRSLLYAVVRVMAVSRPVG